MPGAYTVLSTTPYVELIPPNKTRTVYIVTARSLATGVTWFSPVVRADLNADNLALIEGTLADAFDALANRPGVTDVTVEQGVDAANVITQRVRVGVESTSGDSDAEVTLKWGEIFDSRGTTKIKNARDQLDALEG